MSSAMTSQVAWRAGAIFTATGMALGAFGSHGLRSRTPALSERSISSWTTASQYMIYNGLGLLVVSFHPGLIAGVRKYRIAAGMIMAGGAVFSGTIFALVLAREKVGKVAGPMTPLGGAVMMAGYALLAI